MEDLDLEQKIKMANNQMIGYEPGVESITQQTAEDVVTQPEPVDYYQQQQVEFKENLRKSIPRGTSTLTNKIAEEALGELAAARKRVEVKSDYWKERGDKDRAEMVKQQYMEENFLPTLEMVIIASTPDEVLNAKNILKEFDDLTFEYGPGYTASYIRAAYQDQLGNASNQSDGYVRDQIQRLKYLCSSDQIRAAYGVAKKLKEEIDNGEHASSSDDYEMITRVATIQ